MLAVESRMALDSDAYCEGNGLMNKTEAADMMAVAVPSDPTLEIDSVVLKRLIEEVRTNEPVMAGHYNRTYNRHNR